MADINTALAASKDAIDQLMVAGERTATAWTAPRAPGKWSPSQIVEHVARSLEESANMAAGRPSFDAVLRGRHVRPMNFTGKPLRGFVYVSPPGFRTAASLRTWLSRAERVAEEKASGPTKRRLSVKS